MNLQQFLTTEFGTRLWMSLGHAVPPRLGHGIAAAVMAVVGRRRSARFYRILYANQAGVLGPDASPERVHAAVRAVLRHVGMTAYDLAHLASAGEAAFREALDFGPDVWDAFSAARATGRGVMVCGCHLSNFNLGLLAFAMRGVPVQVLSAAGTAGGFKLMKDLRSRGLLEDTPIDASTLRKAVQRLRQGGVCATAADWVPAADPNELVPFFGRPALLPTGHIRLAISANALLFPIAARWDPQRGYYAICAPAMELELTGDRATDVRHNARRVLAVMERWIAKTPDQWLMHYRVWPEGAAGHPA